MHQILGLREYVDKKDGRTKKATKFFQNKWRAKNLNDLLQKSEEFLSQIPEEERWNIFCTFASCLEEDGRKLKEQWVVPFDIDDIDYNRLEEYCLIICKTLGINFAETGFVATGNGLHVLIGINLPILDKEYFENNKLYYNEICKNLEYAMRKAELPFKEVDRMVFNETFSTRLPGTENRKNGKPTKKVSVINAIINQIDFDVRERSGLSELPAGEALTKPLMREKLDRLPADSDTVLSQCPFMVYASTSIGITERQWYNALNIASHLPDGRTKCHSISKHDPRYSHDETETKSTQAYEKSGPMKCETISKYWDGCKTCPHYGTILSPILLKSEDYIQTEDNGFRIKTKEGGPGKAHLHDVVKFFKKKHKFISLGGSGIIFTWQGTQWSPFPDNLIRKWVMDTIKPAPRYAECEEVLKMLTLENIVSEDFFVNTIDGFMNFKNGVLDLSSWVLGEHSHEKGFTNTIPFDYDEKAECPLFLKTMKKVTENEQELEDVLQEYFGYILSGSEYKYHKLLVMSGSGRNGKSTLIDILRYCLGEGSYSSLPFKIVVNNKENHEMMFKLVNFSEEVGHKEFVNSSSELKTLTGGGLYQVRKLYKDSVTIRNRTKLVLACNELPATDDCTVGFKERLLIVPFKAYLMNDPEYDPHILDKLKTEAPGIINWLIAGFRRLQIQNGFTKSAIVDGFIASYMEDNDSIADFLKNEVTLGEKLADNKQEIYEHYSTFTKSSGAYPLKKTRFFNNLVLLARNNRNNVDTGVKKRIYGSLNPVFCVNGMCLNKNLDRQADHF